MVLSIKCFQRVNKGIQGQNAEIINLIIAQKNCSVYFSRIHIRIRKKL